MNSNTYAAYTWVTDRQAVLAEIEKQIDTLLKGRTTGVFILDVHGPYGSPNADVKELPA